MSHSATKSSAVSTSKGTKKGLTPGYKKYDRVMEYGRDPEKKLKPSEMAKSAMNISGEDYPMIIELVNILDNTSQIHSMVDIDQPLFEPAPNILIFEDYAPFAIHEKKLYFRNRDSVSFWFQILPVNFRFRVSHYPVNTDPCRTGCKTSKSDES